MTPLTSEFTERHLIPEINQKANGDEKIEIFIEAVDVKDINMSFEKNSQPPISKS